MTETIDVGASIDRLAALALAIKAERDELREQLKKARSYMGHDAHCSDREPKGICCCGFKDFLAELPS